MEPYKQGDLDGLCGIYSIINAVRLVHKGLTDDDCDELFQKAFVCLERRKVIRDIITEGITAADISKIMKNVMERKYGITAIRPFRKKKEIYINDLWFEVKTFLNNGKHGAVILSLEKRDHEHWSVVKSITANQITLFDSSDVFILNRKGCTTGKLNKNKHCSLSPSETFFIIKANPRVKQNKR